MKEISVTELKARMDAGDDIRTFLPATAHMFDMKLDDGLPMTGRFTAFAEGGGACHNGVATYNISSTVKNCRPELRMLLQR